MDKSRINELLRARGLTMQDLAKAMNISYQALHASLSANPTLSRLEEIANILCVNVSELFAPSKNLIRCPRCGCIIEAKEYKSEAAQPESGPEN